MSRKPKPSSKELAEMVVLKNFGYSEYMIGRIMGKSNHTIKRYLNSDIYADPQIKLMIEKITKKEINDLKLIGVKSRSCIHKYLNSVLNGDKEPNPIAITAIQDRSFQQRRLLEGNSTENRAVSVKDEEIYKSILIEEAKLLKSLKNTA